MSSSPNRPFGRRTWWPALAAPPALLALASWWWTEPLADPGAKVSTPAPAESRVKAPDPAPAAEAPAAWPETRLDGGPAKRALLDALLRAKSRLDKVETYTATFHKQERIKGVLGPEQTLEMKARREPFAVYFKFVTPQAGKEIVYAEGHHDNKLIAHAGGVSRLLIPRLAVPPDHPLALADSRHAVTEAGLHNLVDRLVGFRKLDLNDPEAVTILDRTTDASGRPWLRSVHTHPVRHDDRPFARVDVLYDPDTFYPLDIRNFDWPEPGQGPGGELALAEHYRYEDLDTSVVLTPADFDPANPSYAFRRY